MCCRSAKLFEAYDADSSGIIDVDEFLVIMQVLDESLQIEDVLRTFKVVGAKDSLDKEHFWLWCENVFGNFDVNSYVDQLQELILVRN